MEIAIEIKPNEGQQAAIDGLLAWLKIPDSERKNPQDWCAALTGGAGSGKLQPLTEPILTPNGWDIMGNIKVGSFVINRRGESTEVLEVFPGKDLDIYKVYFCDGSSTECCNNHLWRIQTPKQRENGNKSIVSLQQILDKNDLHISVKKGYRYSVELTRPIQFDRRQLELHPYLLGVLLGNGHLSSTNNNVITMNRDCVEEMYNLLKNLVPSDVRISICKFIESEPNVGRIFLSHEIRKYLSKLQLLDVKSLDKFVPTEYLYSCIEDRENILAGLLDTDGYSQDSKTRKKVSFSSMSEKLATNVQELARSLGGYSILNFTNREKENKGIEYSVSMRIRKNPFRLSKKAIIFDKYDYKELFVKKIVKIDYIGKKDGQCISVDDIEKLYITKDYTVTHNTFTIKYVLDNCGISKSKIVVSAPTHKAKKVVVASTKLRGETAHALLALKPNLDLELFDVNNPEFSSGKNPKLADYRNGILAFDEASMLGDDLFKKILQTAINNRVKIIFIGERKQVADIKPF